MKKHYNLSRSVRNPYANRLKKQVSLRVGDGVIAYFKQTAQETGITVQTLIRFYLPKYAAHKNA